MKMLNKKRISSFLIVSVILTCLALTACKNNHIREVNDNIETVLAETDAYVEQAKLPYAPEPIDTVLTKEDIWLGEDSFKITGGEPLPAIFEEPDAITFSVNEPVELIQLVDQLREITGLRFSLDELKANNEIPDQTLDLDYTGSLSGLLDLISHRMSIWWKYRKGEISFYKMETRVFTIYALPVEKTTMNASLSGSPVSEEGGNGASTTLDMATSVQLDLWTNIKEGIEQVLGEQGEMLISQTNGTVTVTAPPFTIQKIARYVQDLNEKMSRQVAISVRVLQVTLENADQYGLNLNAIFNSGSLSGNIIGPFTQGSGASTAGQLTLALLDSKWKDSTAIIQALSTQGKTALITSTSVTTLNNKVAPVQVTTQENYVRETTITRNSYSSDDNSTDIEMDTDTLNYGFTMELLPRILDNGRLIMLFTMTLTDLISLTTFSSDGTTSDGNNNNNKDQTDSSGSTSSGEDDSSSGDKDVTVVQLPKMQTRGFVQEIAMRSGSTLVLTGFETVTNKTDTAGIGQPRMSILGGKEFTNQNRNVLVILLTPEILISPLSPETRMENF